MQTRPILLLLLLPSTITANAAMRHGGGRASARAPKKSRMESCTDNLKQQMRAREQHTLLLAKQEDKKNRCVGKTRQAGAPCHTNHAPSSALVANREAQESVDWRQREM
jgi:hypothetical protein